MSERLQNYFNHQARVLGTAQALIIMSHELLEQTSFDESPYTESRRVDLLQRLAEFEAERKATFAKASKPASTLNIRELI